MSTIKRDIFTLLLVATLILLSGCANTTGSKNSGEINDPYETRNRKTHAFNLGLDNGMLRPVAQKYSKLLPDEIENSIGNFAENLNQPSVIVNSLLQGDLKNAGLSTARFLTNTILGFGGFVDAAAEFEMPEHHTDFGETLYTWGVGEGAYLELPMIGPSTVRAATGKVVDLFTNPLSYTLNSPEKYYRSAAGLASGLSNRGRYSDTIDSVLYESIDSYAQTRLIYLQNRRFQLGDKVSHDSNDPYSDPYEDPYAQ